MIGRILILTDDQRSNDLVVTCEIFIPHKNLPNMPKTETKITATPSIQKDQNLSFCSGFRNNVQA